MTPQRYQQIKRIFAEACDRKAAERRSYLDQACAADAELRAEVESLLLHDERSLPLEVGSAAAQALGLDADAAAEPPAAEHIPQRIGRYRIIRKLGEGGMGTVFEAEQDNPRRTVALKMIRPGIASAHVLRRFKLEAHVLGRLQHPGIAQIYEAGTAEVATPDGALVEQPYFALELIRGQPLCEFVRQHDLSVRQRLDLLARICDAVEHAHQHGVIHRDLKPGNVLVDQSGQPKILDFGVARVTDADVQVTTLRTDVGQLVGTLAYMSPEQVAGSGAALDTRSDVYALGVLIFQVLADRLPYDLSDKTIPEAARTVVEEEPAPLTAISRTFRGDLTTIVAKAREKQKHRRYQSASERGAELRHYLANEPISARPATTLYQFGKFARRNPALVGGVLTAFAALVIGIAGTASQAVRATRARDRAQATERVAEQQRAEADAQRIEAQRQAAIARAVNDFLSQDLLAAANPEKERDRAITVREVLDRASTAIGSRFKEQPLVEAAVRTTLGEAYYGLGEYDSAEAHLARALALRRAELGEEDPLTLSTMHTLAGVYSNQARYTDAEALFVKVLALRRRILGEEHRATLATMNLMALLYGRQGRYAEEESLLLATLEPAERTLGAEDRGTMIALSNLADLYAQQRRFAEAEPLYLRNLEVHLRVWGEEHVSTLTTMSNLANLYARQGRFAEAEPLCMRALEIRRRVLGESHPGTLASLNSLAVLYKQQGRYAEAEPLYLQTLAAKRRELGDEHPNTLVSMNNLANLYAVEGRHDEAEQLFLKTLEVRRRVLGESHPQTLSTIANLVELYRSQGCLAEADAWRAKLPTSQPAATKDRAASVGE